MPVSGAQVTGSLESAVTFTLTRTAYARIMHKENTSILLFCCALGYMLLHFLLRIAQQRVLQNMLGRGMLIVLGIVALELTREIEFSGIENESSAPTGSTVARLICLTSMLVFVSVLLDGVSMQYNFVGVFLYIFADAIQSLLHVNGSGMLWTKSAKLGGRTNSGGSNTSSILCTTPFDASRSACVTFAQLKYTVPAL